MVFKNSLKNSMNILNFGSLNIDKVYEVTDIVCPGETITSRNYREFSGGKGLNQSIALADASRQKAGKQHGKGVADVGKEKECTGSGECPP